MSLKLNTKYLESFINSDELTGIKTQVEAAAKTLHEKSGLGNDFLGWVNLPTDYDKDEFARIKAAAKKIQSNSDVLIVIGIGGSYLGARAAIELLKSPLYNNLKKDTPDIYYVGNNINPTYLNEIISLCEDKDFSVNVISKSGTTTEPALAFRVFKKLVEDKYGKEGAKDRIFATTSLAAQERLQITEDCNSLEQALSMAVWNPKSLELERVDDGTSDIDSLDAFEYTFERDIKKYIKK